MRERERGRQRECASGSGSVLRATCLMPPAEQKDKAQWEATSKANAMPCIGYDRLDRIGKTKKKKCRNSYDNF